MKWASIAWRVALCCVLLELWGLIMDVRRGAPDWAARQADATRGAALAAIADTRKDLLAEAHSAVLESRAAIGDITQKADARIADLAVRVDGQLTRTNDTVAGLKPILDHAASITKQADEAAPLFLDCEYNPDCVFNRFQGVSKAVEQMAQAGAKAAPKLADEAVKVGDSAVKVGEAAAIEAHELTKPQTTRQKIAAWLGIIPRVVKLVL